MKTIKNYFLLIRLPNLLIIALTQSICYRYLLNLNTNNTAFGITQLILLICSSVFAAAAGNIINDYFDTKTDAINKPKKAERIIELGKHIVVLLYLLNLLLSIVTAVVFDYLSGVIWLSIFQIVISILLYVYSLLLKRIALVGNLTVSFLCALVLAIVLFAFDVLDAEEVKTDKIIWIYIGFAFLITLFREIIKDIEDVEGDKQIASKTIPILLGQKAAAWLAIIPLLLTALLILALLSVPRISLIAMLLFIAIVAIIFQTLRANSKEKFHSISQFTKWLMLLALTILL